MFPAILKSLSIGAKEDDTPRMHFVNLESTGYFVWLSCQHVCFTGYLTIGTVSLSMYLSTCLVTTLLLTFYKGIIIYIKLKK